MGACTSKPSKVVSVSCSDELAELRKRFKIGSTILGRGRYGRVFKANTLDGSKSVALKLVAKKKLSV